MSLLSSKGPAILLNFNTVQFAVVDAVVVAVVRRAPLQSPSDDVRGSVRQVLVFRSPQRIDAPRDDPPPQIGGREPREQGVAPLRHGVRAQAHGNERVDARVRKRTV